MLAAKKRRRKEKEREREECKKQRRAVIPFYVDCAAKLSAKAPLATRHEAPFRRRLQARSGPCCLRLPAAIKTNANMKSKWNPFNLANKSDCQGTLSRRSPRSLVPRQPRRKKRRDFRLTFWTRQWFVRHGNLPSMRMKAWMNFDPAQF